MERVVIVCLNLSSTALTGLLDQNWIAKASVITFW